MLVVQSNANISDIKRKYYTTSGYNKFASEILDQKLKQKNLAKNSDLNTVLHCAIKNEKNIEKLKVFENIFSRLFFFYDGFQNTFFYQTTLKTLKSKEGKDTEYTIGWK